MWRLWTRSWGLRSWCFWFGDEGFPKWVAMRLPKRIALWTFIRVYAKDGQAPLTTPSKRRKASSTGTSMPFGSAAIAAPTWDRWAPGTFRQDACLSVVVRQCVHSEEVTTCCELRLRYCAR